MRIRQMSGRNYSSKIPLLWSRRLPGGKSDYPEIRIWRGSLGARQSCIALPLEQVSHLTETRQLKEE
jgi:hypothetical protein